jgi:uncharacterized membrane protein YoaK (UPF0700 family)
MFKHSGKSRTIKHNIRIATLLSFVAGMVNIAGFLAVHRLTTNVTGHFAFFIEEINMLKFWNGFIYFLYIFFFFMGAFVANVIVEIVAKKSIRYSYTIPILIESIILFTVAYFGSIWMKSAPNLLAFLLLFAMGLQNSLVTVISNSIVRTTHLTGLFTDLGIEISQLFFFKKRSQRKQLLASIRLHVSIIGSFFTGGIICGFLYSQIGIQVLSISGVILIIGISLSRARFYYLSTVRKISGR